jgi:hypothetical protein
MANEFHRIKQNPGTPNKAMLGANEDDGMNASFFLILIYPFFVVSPPPLLGCLRMRGGINKPPAVPFHCLQCHQQQQSHSPIGWYMYFSLPRPSFIINLMNAKEGEKPKL